MASQIEGCRLQEVPSKLLRGRSSNFRSKTLPCLPITPWREGVLVLRKPREMLRPSIVRIRGSSCTATLSTFSTVHVSSWRVRGTSSTATLSTLADATSRVLQSAEVSGSSSPLPGPSLEALQALTAASPPRPVSILMLQASARDFRPQSALMHAQFLRGELTARRAHIMSLLHTMPEPLASQPQIAGLTGIYWERLRWLLTLPELQTDTLRHFTARMNEENAYIDGDGTDIEMGLAVDALSGMQSARGGRKLPVAERRAVDRHLDAILIARIGLRFLLMHYAESEKQRAAAVNGGGGGRGDGGDGGEAGAGLEGEYAGILHTRCSPVAICDEVAVSTRQWLYAEYGLAPDIEVKAVGDRERTFTFVPSHLRYVIGELLKNSCVATLRHEHNRRRRALDGTVGGAVSGAVDSEAANATMATSTPPPVRVIVAMSDGAVQLKLVDEAGGISRSSLTDTWSYRALDSKWWRPSDGLSLPLARLYCQYFGGSLELVPMEGFGTDCYITFNRLAHENSEQILPVPEVNDGGEGALGVGLLDAQRRSL